MIKVMDESPPLEINSREVGRTVEAITKITYQLAVFIMWVFISVVVLGITSYIIIDAWHRGIQQSSWATGLFGAVVGNWTPTPNVSKIKKRIYRVPATDHSELEQVV